jgi:colanic acid biosynthesis protein WcaH
MSPKFAPQDVFDQILEWSVIPTFDLILEYGDKGVILLKRTITPYKDVWAFPGLRMYKGETIEDTIIRIAKAELGITINPTQRIILGQYTAQFDTDNERQDISTGFLIRLTGAEELAFNKEHFSELVIAKTCPKPAGAMYEYYFQKYLDLQEPTN